MIEMISIVNFLGMIGLPILAAIFFSRKSGLSWKLFLAGGLTYIASQLPHIPLVMAISKTMQSWSVAANMLTLGLLAGLFEETARYILLKFILRKSRTWNEGLFVGLGHSGTESIIFGIMASLVFFSMLAYRHIDPSSVSIPASGQMTEQQLAAAYWSRPVYEALLGLGERIFAICLHTSLSITVLYAVVKRKAAWYWFAVLLHTAVDGVAAFLAQRTNGLSLDVVVAVAFFTIIGVGVAFWLKPQFGGGLSAEMNFQRLESNG